MVYGRSIIMSKKKKMKESKKLESTFNKDEKLCCSVIRSSFLSVKEALYDSFLDTYSEIENISSNFSNMYCTVTNDSEYVEEYCDVIDKMLSSEITDRIKILKDLKEEDKILYNIISRDVLADNLTITEEKVYRSLEDYIVFKSKELLEVFRDTIIEASREIHNQIVDSYKRDSVNAIIITLESQCYLNNLKVDFDRLRKYTELFCKEAFPENQIKYIVDQVIDYSIVEHFDATSKKIYEDGMNILKSRLVKLNFEEVELKKAFEHTLLSWKELEQKILNNNFSLVRQNGDHGIYKNASGQVIVMPRGREIGKGLQIKILKQLEEC